MTIEKSFIILTKTDFSMRPLLKHRLCKAMLKVLKSKFFKHKFNPIHFGGCQPVIDTSMHSIARPLLAIIF
jgi:hypothetical protein